MGSRDIMNYVVVAMQWNFLAYYCCMGVYTSNNHSQQGHAKFTLRVKVSRYGATCISDHLY